MGAIRREEDKEAIQPVSEAAWKKNRPNWRHKTPRAPTRQSRDFTQLIMSKLEVSCFQRWTIFGKQLSKRDLKIN